MKDVKELLTKQATPKIGSVVFYGTCQNCGDSVDITAFLSLENKMKYVQQFGITFDGSNAVCRYNPPIDYCIACAVFRG